jgi:predicted HAD superfamily Cof-like phosphohydrolase
MFKEPKALNSVAKFHRAYLHPIEKLPKIPDKTRTRLRVKLIQEELNELRKAIKENNIVLVADALCDMQYVLSGAVLEFGLGNSFKDLFNEVQRSNLTKGCNTKKEAIETIINCMAEYKNENFEYKKIKNKYIVYRKSDNKIMKSINYSQADILRILNNNYNLIKTN